MKTLSCLIVFFVLMTSGVLFAQEAPEALQDWSALGDLQPTGPGRAVAVGVLPGYPEIDTVGIRWLTPEELPTSKEPAVTVEGEKAVSTISGRAVYRHPIGNQYVSNPGVRVQLLNYNNWQWIPVAWQFADEHGEFSFSVNITGGCHYYKLVFSATNLAVDPNDSWPYASDVASWESDALETCYGQSWHLGYVYPSELSDSIPAHVAASLFRNWAVIQYLTGDSVAPVHVRFDAFNLYPQYYNDAVIWVDWTPYCLYDGPLAAQYARYWMAQFCFVSEDDCGLDGEPCPTWCDNLAQTAYTQGLADWFGDIIPKRYAMYFDYTPYNGYDFENLGHCSTVYGDPNLAPGFFAAVLTDIQDSQSDLHTAYGSIYRDALSLGHQKIIQAAAFTAPTDPLSFLRWLRDSNPQIVKELWETSINCGFDIDDVAPAGVTDITSSHIVGTPSPDGTIEFGWVGPADDASGLAGYSVTVTTRFLPPDQIMDIGNVTTYTTNQLAPGDWYFSIRAVDRSGRWSDDYEHVGPFTILPPEPVDLKPYARTGWDYPVVPRPTSDASAIFCPAPTSLVGGALTYLSTCGTNAGEAATPDKFAVQFLVDGEALAVSYGVGPVNGGEDYWVLNKSTRVSGGRHTLESFHEWREIYAEQIETNNRWSAQWAWQPPLLTAGVPVVKTAPPDPEGGWDALPPATTAYANCEGFRFASGADWRMVSMTPLDAADDYDLRLYTPTTSPANGFAGSLEASTREVGELEALLVHGRVAGASDWDVGVVNRGRLVGAADYEIELVTASPFTFGDSLTVTQAEGEMLLLREVDIATENVGWVTITVDVRPATQKVRWYWFDNTFDTGALLDRTMLATSDATGRARRTVQVSQAGYCGLVVARDPLDGTAPDTLIIEVEPGLPDLTPLWATDWYSPLVPRPAQDGTLTLVALPDTLHGNAPLTWFNMAVWNASPAPILADWDIVLDGVTKVPFTRANMAGFAKFKIPSSVPNEVRGGRHTLALRCDNGQGIEELLETNNVFGEQYVWSPLPLVYGTPVTRWTPPDPTGGWQDLPPDSTRYYNCDGLRLPAAGGHFGAVAVMPGDSCNVNVRLHEPGVGAKQGFGESLASSQWGVDQSDYVLVNSDLAGTRPLDVGLVNFGGNLNCVAEAVASVPLVFDGDDTYGPFTLPAGRTLDLYALPLTAGPLAIALENRAGTVDWGLSLHPADIPFMGKSTTLDSVQAYFEGPGAGETLAVQVPASGWYCLAVWKVGSADLGLAGEYGFSLQSGVSGVGDDPVPVIMVSALASIQPNPFNPSTRVVLDVATAGPVRLEVFDARGRCVCRLVDRPLSAGRQEFVWDGRDDNGRTMPSGTYFARFAAGRTRQTAKMVLVK